MASGTFALPAPDSGWLLIKGQRVAKQAATFPELVGRGDGVLVGLPTELGSTFSVSLPTGDSGLFEDMVFAQLEKRGYVSRADGELLYDFDVLSKRPEGSTLAVHAVENLPDDAWAPGLVGYTLADNIWAEPGSELVVRREWGRLILSVFAAGELVHSQILSGADRIGGAVGEEIRLILLTLGGDPALSELEFHTCQLALEEEGVDPMDLSSFQSASDLRASVVSATATRSRADARARLLPSTIKRARRGRSTGRIVTLAVIVGLAIYGVVAALLWKKAETTRNEIAALEDQVSVLQPDVERIQAFEERWRTLEPAFDLEWFPVLQLSRITEAMPGSGVVLREYRTEGRKITIRGQARDVQFANRLLEDLQSNVAFEAYEWTMPNPKVESNNTATFVMEARPKDARIDG
ncbi:MAG: PilN domain-containing protein [Verrucomicrobiota bacterium]